MAQHTVRVDPEGGLEEVEMGVDGVGEAEEDGGCVMIKDEMGRAMMGRVMMVV